MIISIFTPTYNRQYTLLRLYESLCRQTSKEFEWLIVDDGSTDNTEILVKSFERKEFPIRYYKKENGGKTLAINDAVLLVQGEWFFIVDSDDYLVDNAIEVMLRHIAKIDNEKDFAAIVGYRIAPDGQILGNKHIEGFYDTDSSNFQTRYQFRGNYAEILRTSVMKEYPFPNFEGEKYCTESVIWYRIAQKYKYRYVDERIYVCEFLPGGITDTGRNGVLAKANLQYSALFFKEQFYYDIPMIKKIIVAGNYWYYYMQSCKRESLIKPTKVLLLFFPLYFIRKVYQQVRKMH